LGVTFATSAALLFFYRIQPIDKTAIALIFLLPVGLSATFWGLIPGILAAAASFLAIALGMLGTLLYTRQAVQSRQARETLELGNVRAVAAAAETYAAQHEGAYPPDLLALLEDGQLPPQALQSPYGRRDPLFDDFPQAHAVTPRQALLTSVETASDYLYLAADLKTVPPPLAGDILVAVSSNTVLRVSLAVAFADHHARFITLEEVPKVMTDCNAARAKMGLGPVRPPSILQAALDEGKAETKK